MKKALDTEDSNSAVKLSSTSHSEHTLFKSSREGRALGRHFLRDGTEMKARKPGQPQLTLYYVPKLPIYEGSQNDGERRSFQRHCGTPKLDIAMSSVPKFFKKDVIVLS